MSYSQIRLEAQESIGQVIFDRPAVRNAQSRIMLEELDQALHEMQDDKSVKVIVVRGEGGHFSAGHDLGTPEEVADQKLRPMEEGLRGRYQRSYSLFVDYTLRWRNLKKPTIAAVEGYCIFGGWMIASAMDLIFAAKDAMFLGTNFQYFSAPWDIPARKLKEILFESRFIDAQEAVDLGLVNRIFSADSLLDETLRYAARIAVNDHFQLRMIKAAINQQQDTQGFVAHLNAAHSLHMLSSEAERDPGFELAVPDGTRRRPMVQRALENYQLLKANQNDE